MSNPMFGTTMLGTWLCLAHKTAQLSMEAQGVIALRMMRIANGGVAAQSEIRRCFPRRLRRWDRRSLR